MPWSVLQREGKWCVVKDSDGEVEGCHDSRGEAIKQQRALYANEPKVSSIMPKVKVETQNLLDLFAPTKRDPVRIEVEAAPAESDRALLASITLISERLVQAEQVIADVVDLVKQMREEASLDREAFQAALTAAVSFEIPIQEAPIVNVTVPEIVIPAPEITVTNPEPIVNVKVEMPETVVRKEVSFERDPLTGQVTSATVEEFGG